VRAGGRDLRCQSPRGQIINAYKRCLYRYRRVIVGDLIGHGAASDKRLSARSELAVRLQALAEPETVVIAAGTRGYRNLFDTATSGRSRSRASPAPVPAGQVLRQCRREPVRAIARSH